MPRNGSGIYSLPAQYLAETGQTIEAVQHNTPFEDLAADANGTRPVSAGGTGESTAAAARQALGAGATAGVVDKAAGTYSAVKADHNYTWRATGAVTVNLTAAATLTAGWCMWVKGDGGAITVDPNSSEQINGATTLVIPDGVSALIICTGSAFRAAVFGDVTLTGTQTLTNKTITSPTITGGSWTGGTDLAIADGGTGASTAANAFAALKQAASDTATGVVELATAAEVATGTDTARVPSVATMKSHQGIAIAWVNFNGTGTVAIRDSYNVSSITDNGTGDYTINFASALTNANYCPVFGQISNGASGPIVNTGVAAANLTSAPTTKTTSALRINTGATNAPGLYDLAEIYCAILGD